MFALNINTKFFKARKSGVYTLLLIAEEVDR